MGLTESDCAEVLASSAQAAGVGPLARVEELAASGRTLVWRVTDGTATYVVKVYLSDDNHPWAREASALGALSSSSAPRLLGACSEPQLIVMSDLGLGGSLADVVMADDPSLAGASVADWAGSLAHLHQDSAGVADSYAELLARRASQQVVHDRPRALREAADILATVAPRLRVSVSDEAKARLSAMAETFAVPMQVLSPGDTCPDNNLVNSGRLAFLDFEFAEVRHAAWDVAYVRVPWPTCWCAWRLPAEVSERALARYREVLRASIAGVDSPEFEHDVDVATLGWCLESAAMFLEEALSPKASGETMARRPGRRPLVLDRLAQASGMTVDRVLADLGRELHVALLREWGEDPLDLAPAFRPRSKS